MLPCWSCILRGLARPCLCSELIPSVIERSYLFGGCHQGPIASTGPVFNPVLGLRLGPAHLLFQTPSVLLSKIFFIGSDAITLTYAILYMLE